MDRLNRYSGDSFSIFWSYFEEIFFNVVPTWADAGAWKHFADNMQYADDFKFPDVGIGPVHKTPRTEPSQIVSGEAVIKKMQYKD